MSLRLDAQREAPACLECGAAFETDRSTALFCCAACRKTWNNRRMTRGAEVYDLLMALRYERGAAQLFHILTLISRLAAIYRGQDSRERAGRRSWAPPGVVVERHPALTSTVILTKRAS